MNNIVMNWKNQMISIVGKIEKKVGKYEWRVGEDGNDTVKILKSFITPEALKTLVDFTNIELGYNTVYKESLTK